MCNKTGLVIDGSSMLTTAYYANLPGAFLREKDPEKQKLYADQILHTSDGRYTNGLYGMLKSFLSLVRVIHPDFVAIAFDDSRDTFRRTQLGASFYKANRSATPSYLKEQFAYAKDFFKRIGLQVLSGSDYEADDYVASVVMLFKSACDVTYVHSKDHDFMQLVSDDVKLIRPMSGSSLRRLQDLCGKQSYGFDRAYVYDERVVFDDIGVSPLCVCDYMAVAGDSGDGVPGCRGVKGAAVPLISHYQDIETLYTAIDEAIANDAVDELKLFWKNKLGIKRSPFAALVDGRDSVFLSKKLVTMVKDVSLNSYDINDYAYTFDSGDVFLNVAADYEMKSFKVV